MHEWQVRGRSRDEWPERIEEKTSNISWKVKLDSVCDLKRPHQAVSECSLPCERKLCDACLEETLAAFLCECQLLLRCTSRRSLCDWCEPVPCPARTLWFLLWLQREANQSAGETWPMVKHGKASFVSLQINHKGVTFSELRVHMCSYITADSCHKHSLVPTVQTLISLRRRGT